MPERRILASLIVDNSLIADCSLSADDFIEDAHREIYRQIQFMTIQRKPFDGLTLADRLEEITKRKGWDGMLSKMVQDLPTTVNFPIYVEALKDKAKKRKAMEIGQALLETGDGDTAIVRIMALKDAQKKGGKVLDAVNFAVSGVEAISAGGNPGVMTGLKDLDNKFGGFHKSDLVIIAGRPSMGKTAIALNMANNCEVPCGFISAEQSMEQIGQRIIALAGEVSVHKMRSGDLNDDDWKKTVDVMSKMVGKEMYINDKPTISLLDIQREGRRWKHHYDIKILFVDYLQKIQGTKQNTRDEVSEIVVGLKNLARELDIPVVALAQIKREVETRPNKRPYMADIAESGVIEREADQIITLYRDEVYNENTMTKGILELILCKNRHGPLGTILTTWRAEYMQVKNYAPIWGT